MLPSGAVIKLFSRELPMTVRANADTKFLLKYLLIGLGCIAFGAWACYDGFIKFPAKLPISKAWDALVANEDLDDAQRDAQYKELAAQNGWPSKHPSGDKTVEAMREKIIYQYVMIVLGFGIGLPCLIWYLRNCGTWVELTDQVIKSSWGRELRFDQIRQFDKKKWDKKGIGVLSYDTPAGPQKFVIDDLKFSRLEMDEIVRTMEAHIPAEMIVNGQPEKQPTPDPALAASRGPHIDTGIK